jgi:3-oxoacyl-[acyl-carrier protein] reductase
MNLKLKGKYALITGGSRGIGRSTALMLADEGCNVAICARDSLWLKKTKLEVESKGVQVLAIVADAKKLIDIQRVVEVVITTWGTLHILINNVGGEGTVPLLSPECIPDEIWIDSFELNTLAAIRFTQLVLPHMRKQKWGRVVTIASKHGREGGGRAWYTMAKAAEIGYMKTLAMNYNLAKDLITFNTVAPGAILTEQGNWVEFKKTDPHKYEEKVMNTRPLGRLGLPEEVAAIIIFICSEQASLLSGACIPVDGAESHAF